MLTIYGNKDRQGRDKFYIDCDFRDRKHLQVLPGLRWSKSKEQYYVNYSRAAARLLANLKVPHIVDKSAFPYMERAAKKPKAASLPFPEDYQFATEPMAHQRKALDFLWGKTEAALFMGMRTGKTKTVIDWWSALIQKGEIKSVLVICPYSVRLEWVKQIKQHCPLPMNVACYDLSTAKGKEQQKAFNEDQGITNKVTIIGIRSLSTGAAKTYIKNYLELNSSSLCVVDESHNIKNPKSAQTEVITELGKLCSHKVSLTGTPIASAILDLFAQYYFLNPEIIGFSDYFSFKCHYAIMGGYEGKEITGYKNQEELLSSVAPFTFQLATEEVADLPPKTYVERYVQLPKGIRTLYTSIKTKQQTLHEGKTLTLSNPLDRLMRLSRLATGEMAYGEKGEAYSYSWEHNAKIEELLNLLEENPVPTVVWTTGNLELRKALEAVSKKYKTTAIHGGVSEQDRHIRMAQFQTGTVDVLICNPAIGSQGLNMSRAKMLVYLSNSFKYIDRVQSEERATDVRASKEDNGILIVDILTENTVDTQVIKAALNMKKDVAEYVRDKLNEFSEGL